MTGGPRPRVTVRAARWVDVEQRLLGFKLVVRVAGSVVEVVEVPVVEGVDTMAEVRRQRALLERAWLPNGGS